MFTIKNNCLIYKKTKRDGSAVIQHIFYLKKMQRLCSMRKLLKLVFKEK